MPITFQRSGGALPGALGSQRMGGLRHLGVGQTDVRLLLTSAVMVPVAG